MNPARSCQLKKCRAARPLAKWKIDAPTIIVLSTSKKAAACGSSGTCCGRVSSSPLFGFGLTAVRVSTRADQQFPSPIWIGPADTFAHDELTEMGSGSPPLLRPDPAELLPPIRPGIVGNGTLGVDTAPGRHRRRARSARTANRARQVERWTVVRAGFGRDGAAEPTGVVPPGRAGRPDA